MMKKKFGMKRCISCIKIMRDAVARITSAIKLGNDNAANDKKQGDNYAN